VTTYRTLIEKHLVPEIGAIKLKRLRANDVDGWLDGLAGKLPTASQQKLHRAQARHSAGARPRQGRRNIAELWRAFRSITEAAGICDEWTSHELRAYLPVDPEQ
jgi:hypothetical protein